MIDKRCTGCGGRNPAHANFCSSCGGQGFVEASADQLPDVSPAQRAVPDSIDLRLSTTRLIVLSVVTSGVYILYWLYLTWRQLQAETRDVHYPVWHALSFFIPVYQLFRVHKHIRVIQEISQRVGIETSLAPGMAVALVALYWLVSLTSLGVENPAALLVIRLALITTVIVGAQATLNRYWRSTKGDALRSVPIGRGEVGFIVVVLFIQLWQVF